MVLLSEGTQISFTFTQDAINRIQNKNKISPQKEAFNECIAGNG